MPDYVVNFKCVIDKCPDSCCRANWQVVIDENTYRKYKKLRPASSDIITKNITRNRVNPTSETYAKMKLDKDGCVFLQSDGLCTLQVQYGEDYLCNVCATYPRVTNLVNGGLEKCTTLSCPEAARLVLQIEHGISFSQYEESVSSRNLISTSIDTKEKKWAKKAGNYFDEMRGFSFQVLHTREYSLNDRFVLLGLFYEQAENEIRAGKAEKIPELIGEISDNVDKYIQYAYECMEKDTKDQGAFYFEILYQLGIIPSAENKDMIITYKETYKTFSPLIKEYEYMLENYFVNYAFQIVFPLHERYSLFQAYVIFMLHFIMIQNQLFFIAAQLKTLTAEQVILYIQNYSKMIEHKANYFDKMLVSLASMQKMKMDKLIYLIKGLG
jgi:lysine-N-methylase